MKDLINAFGKDVLRPISTLLLPGLLALAPYILLLLYADPRVRTLAAENQLVAVVMTIASGLFIGMLLEEFGAHVEQGWDNLRGDRHVREWYTYLDAHPDAETLLFRYIRSLVIRLKFALAAYTAILLAIPGAFAAASQLLAIEKSYWISAGMALVAIALRYEAAVLHLLLAETRRDWANRVNKVNTLVSRAPKSWPRARDRKGKVIYVGAASTLLIWALIGRTPLANVVFWLFHNRFTDYVALRSPTMLLLSISAFLVFGVIWLMDRVVYPTQAYQWWRMRGWWTWLLKSHRPLIHIHCYAPNADSVYIVGSSEELGRWKVLDRNRLTPSTTDSQGDGWRYLLRATEGIPVWYKFIYFREGKMYWEEGEDRVVVPQAATLFLQRVTSCPTIDTTKGVHDPSLDSLAHP